MAVKRENKAPRDFVGSVRHVLDVLKSFDGDHPQMTLSSVSERTGMTRAGARRYLLTLEHLGYIRKDDRQFRLTARVLELGFAFLSTMPLSDVARPYLQWITRETGEITGLAVLDQSDIVHIAGSSVERMLHPTLTIGRRFNALYASSGRAIAAFLEPPQVEELLKACEIAALTPQSLKTKEEIRAELKVIRRQGYAVVDQEVEGGVRSIAVPVLNRQGVPLAAVTVLTNVATVSKKQLVEEILPVLQRIVPEIPIQALSAGQVGRPSE
jgi:IclR family transcriptional regulator, pca regulon regulatory protein